MKKQSASKTIKNKSTQSISDDRQMIIDKLQKEIFYLNSIIKKLPGSIYWKDKNGAYLGCNDVLLEMAGTKDVIGKTDFDLPWKDNAKIIRKVDNTVVTTGTPIELEEHGELANGQQVIMLTRKAPLKDEQSNIVGIMGVSVDITQRKKLEKALQDANENKFYKILDVIPASVYWKDKDGAYMGCNKYMLEMAGLTEHHEIVGKRDDQLVWKDIAEKLFEVDKNVITNKMTIEIEEKPIISNNQERTFLTTKTPLLDEKAEAIGLIGVSMDISERKKQEVILKEAKERAEVANKTKTEFLENMRHDIRTPLIGITGFAHIISEEATDPKIKEYVDNLTASSHALLDLLNEILEVIKVNSGDIPLVKKKFDLKKRLVSVIDINKARAKAKNINLIFEFDKNIPHYIIGDSTRVHRVILELISNALNFTDKGSVKLTVQLAKNEDRNLIVKIIVEDTGMGIAPDKQQEIFLQFKRLTNSYEGIYKGAGLGLAIVKQFTDELDGEIYVDSQIGVGTKFTCVIPFKKSLLDDTLGSDDTVLITSSMKYDEPVNQSRIAATASKQEITQEKNSILLVEDQLIAAKVVNLMLDKLNCQVDIASDGEIAMQLAQEKDYDLIFMDIGLPEIDGYEATRRIRLNELKKGKNIPIIALTAHVDEENKKRCIEAGMNAILTKPLSSEMAKDILDAFIPYRNKQKSTQVNQDTIKPTEHEDKIIDFEFLKKQMGGNEQAANEMLKILINSLSSDLKNLQNSYAKKDWVSIKSIAHKLKGGSAYCGAMRLNEACTNLETAINSGKKELFSSAYEKILFEIDAIKNTIMKKDY